MAKFINRTAKNSIVSFRGGDIHAPAGGSVRTPTMHPGTAYYIYYGCSSTQNGLDNKICFQNWSP